MLSDGERKQISCRRKRSRREREWEEEREREREEERERNMTPVWHRGKEEVKQHCTFFLLTCVRAERERGREREY